jgi:hypothetical protein
MVFFSELFLVGTISHKKSFERFSFDWKRNEMKISTESQYKKMIC